MQNVFEHDGGDCTVLQCGPPQKNYEAAAAQKKTRARVLTGTIKTVCKALNALSPQYILKS